jgi:hypothetical protein
MITTMDNATDVAQLGVETLFRIPEFARTHDRARLEQEIRMATLKKLVTEDSDILSEEEFTRCCIAAKLV